jgi:hypothetical protein
VIRRNTQDPAYWQEFQVTDEDLDSLGNVLVEQEIPLSLDELARELVAYRLRVEESKIASELAKGTIYLPKDSYEVGETIVFPAFEYSTGTVKSIREGHNPEYGTFQVIKVAFSKRKHLEFATGLEDHPLNEQLPTDDENLLSAEDLYEQYGAVVKDRLDERLESTSSFIRLAGSWFLIDLLVDMNEGHLNIAEAVLDVAGGGPLPTDALIGDLDLSKEIKPQLGIFSLNYALQEDERFDEVGPAGEVLWYLRRLQPAPVLNPPERLRPRVLEYDHRLLDETMLNLERRLDDEWSDLVALPAAEEPITLTLTHPHRCSGTLPLSSQLTRVFPTGRTHRIRFMFRDTNTGDEMEGWVVREHRFVFGLLDWYERNELPVGAYIDLAHSDEPGVVLISHRARRTRREWVRVTTVENDRLTFEMSRYPLSCEVDERMVIATEDLGSLQSVADRVKADGLTLEAVIAEIVPELTKLSPQGNAHASTIYSAVNVVLRTPPGPILAILVGDERYSPMGDNYWVLRSRESGT